jgi:hypothetical protein
MTLARARTLTVIALSVILLAGSVEAQGPGQGNANGHNKSNGISIPVSTVPGSPVTGTGIFTLQRFVNDDGTVKAIGVVTGTFTNGTQSVSIVRNVALPVTLTQSAAAAAAAELNDALESGPSDGRDAVVAQLACPILHLDLGPLDLNILGLDIELSRVILDIVAESGAGNLLGNLLCAVVNLLNSPGPLANLLNQILALLG